MEYFLFAGLSAADQTRFQQFIDAQGPVFSRQAEFDFEDGKFGFAIKQPATGAFKALPDGSIKLVREIDQPNMRVRMSPMWSGDTQRWRYLKLDQPYRFELDFFLPYRKDNYKGVDWANLFEIWGPFDADDEGRNPALEIMLRGGKGVFEFRQRGDSRPDHDREYEYGEHTSTAFRHGTHRLVVDTVLSYSGNGSTTVWLNDRIMFSETGITNTYNSDPFNDGKQMGGMINFPEIYSPPSSLVEGPIEMIVSRVRVSDEVGAELGTKQPSSPSAPSKPEPNPEPVENPKMSDFRANLDFKLQDDGTYAVTGEMVPILDPPWSPPTSKPSQPAPSNPSQPKYSDEIIDPSAPSKPSPVINGDTPMFDVIDNSLAYPKFQAVDQEERGWENPSVIYARSKMRTYGTVKIGKHRHLYEAGANSRDKRLIKEHIILQSVFKAGAMLGAWALEHKDGKMRLLKGYSTNFDDWTWQSVPFRDFVPHGGLGDVLHGQEGMLWIKGDEFVKEGDKYVDYLRHWFCNGEPLQIDLPDPLFGRRYDIYSMAVFEPGTKDWKCRTKYVALLGLFHITNDDNSWNHMGMIDLVWATSDDGVKWDLPYGVSPAVDRGSLVKMVQPGAFLPFGKDLRVYCGAARFGHNMYDRVADKTVGTGVITMRKAKFEEAFG